MEIHISAVYDEHGEIVGAVEVFNDRASAVALRRLEEIEASNVAYKEDTIKVSASVGATLALPTDTLQSLVERADRLLFEAKAKKRLENLPG